MDTATLSRHMGRMFKAADATERNVKAIERLWVKFGEAQAEYWLELMRPDARALDAAAKVMEASAAITKTVVCYLKDATESRKEQAQRMREKRDAEGRPTLLAVGAAMESRGKSKSNGAKQPQPTQEEVNELLNSLDN